MQPAGQDPEARLVPGTVTLPLRSRTNASPFWIMLLLVWGRLDNGMIPFWQPDTGVAKMPSHRANPQRPADQLTRALGEAVIRIWSNLPQDVQNHLFREARQDESQGEIHKIAGVRSAGRTWTSPRTPHPLGRHSRI